MTMVDKQGNKVVEVFDDSYDRDVIHVALNLRADDFDEVFDMTGESPHYAIQSSWFWSFRKWIIFNAEGEAVAVAGIVPVSMFSDVGIPWLLGTDGLNKMKKFFLKAAKFLLKEMKRYHNHLENYVDASYTKAIRWLEWLGFEIEEAVPFGALDKPFHKFYMECA